MAAASPTSRPRSPRRRPRRGSIRRRARGATRRCGSCASTATRCCAAARCRSTASTTRCATRSAAWASSCTTRSASASPPRRSASCTACSSTAWRPRPRSRRWSTRCSSGRATSARRWRRAACACPACWSRSSGPVHVRVRAQDERGEAILVEASGLEARVIQHEIDHLDGVLILDRTSRDQRKQAMRTLRERARRAARRRGLSRRVAHGLPRHLAVRRRGARAAGGGPAPPGARRHAARPPARPRPRAAVAAGRRARRAALGLDADPARGAARARRARRGSPPPAPDVLVVCAYGVLVREPLLCDYEILNVHPRCCRAGAGRRPIERAIMAGDAGDRRLDHAPHRGARLRARSACAAAEPIRPDDDYGTLVGAAAAARRRAARARARRAPAVRRAGRGAASPTRRRSRPADRALDPARTPAEVERTVRALRPHIGARLPLPDGSFLGVLAARPATARPPRRPAGACGRDGERLLLVCRGGALELLEIRPPGGRPMPGRGVAARPAGPGADRLPARPASCPG